MNADIITDATYPHGTPQGFTDGCHGSHCPSDISCRTVHTRYNGDWAFRRQIESGMTALDIITLERAQAHETAQAAHEARTHTTRTPTTKRRHERREPIRKGLTRTPNTELQVSIANLVHAGYTDREIGDRIGKTRDQVTATRKWLNMACNPARPRTATVDAGVEQVKA